MTFALTDELPDIVAIEPFPVPSGSRRRRVIGVDVWLELRPTNEGAPRPDLHSTLSRTGCRLLDVTVVTAPDDSTGRRLRARVVARHDDAHLTDEAVTEVLAALALVGHWSLARKLEEFDATPAFPPIARQDTTG